MEITETLDPNTRRAWRAWLAANHASARAIWLLLRPGRPDTITYLDAVEEAICFGWIDSTAKRHDDATAQRFTPRKVRSHWTELNKARARRMIAAGLMSDAGRQTLPDLSQAAEVSVPDDIRERLMAEPGAWTNFLAFPSQYQRVRLGYIEEMRTRDPREWEKRLANFVAKTKQNAQFGNWDDARLPRTEP
ncbi:MAG: YdeI/OmpD-associated family protein [Myxococcales bacterium]|nr:YdeI/OmpD-associated family protein [Myxococcales bacterium]